jgi:hypothetical protein
LDTGNSYNKYLKIPPEDPDQLIWALCFTGILYAVDEDARNVAQ